MKTLLKNLENKYRKCLTVYAVKVNDGVAYTTDLDIEVSQPCDLESGFYAPETFGGLNVRAEIMADKFHIFLKNAASKLIPAEISIIHRSHLEFLMSSVSIDNLRYYICGLAVDAKNSALVTTDGHRMSVMQCSGWPERLHDRVRIVPTKALLLAIMACKESRTQNIKFGFIGEGSAEKAVFSVGPITIVSKLIDGTYPDWQRVVPAPEGLTAVQWNAEEYAEIYPHIGALAKVYKDKTPTVKINGSYQYREHQFPIAQAWPLEVGFNAKYLKAVPRGTVYLAGGGKAALFHHDNSGLMKTVLMPCRL